MELTLASTARLAAIILLPSLAAGCLTAGDQPAPSLAEMKRSLVVHKREQWKDPESVKDARIGAPFQCVMGGTCVCVEVNAKNSYGGYIGVRQYTASFYGNAVSTFREQNLTESLSKTCNGLADFAEYNGAGVPNPARAATR